MERLKSPENKSKSADIIPRSTNETATKKDIELMLSPLDGWKRDLFQHWLSNPSVSIGSICERFKFDKTSVSVALKIDKKFSSIYNKVRKICDKIELMNLERVSEVNAMEPKNMVERLFRLKSLDRDRYADRGKNGANIDININFGDGVATYKKIKESSVDAEVSTEEKPKAVHHNLTTIVKGV